MALNLEPLLQPGIVTIVNLFSDIALWMFLKNVLSEKHTTQPTDVMRITESNGLLIT